jgi:hypothetical protein
MRNFRPARTGEFQTGVDKRLSRDPEEMNIAAPISSNTAAELLQ